MARLLAFKLNPLGAFHFGAYGDAARVFVHCSSDRLYAALLVEALRGGRPFFAPPADHDDSRPLDPPLLLASAFPYAGEALLLPCPRLPPPVSVAEKRRLAGLSYVSPTIFALMVRGEPGALDAYLDQAGALLMGGSVWVAHSDGALPSSGDDFWRATATPRVTIDRRSGTLDAFLVGQVTFNAGCGLYVLARERTPGAAEPLAELLQRVGDSGLGGRRSAGLGQFRVESVAPPSLPALADPRRMVLLSRYRPSLAELAGQVLGPGARYDLDTVGGWLQSDHPSMPAQLRRSVRLLREGSVIQLLPDGSPPIGSICNVAPEGDPPVAHPVWRYGLALGIGIGA